MLGSTGWPDSLQCKAHSRRCPSQLAACLGATCRALVIWVSAVLGMNVTSRAAKYGQDLIPYSWLHPCTCVKALTCASVQVWADACGFQGHHEAFFTKMRRCRQAKEIFEYCNLRMVAKIAHRYQGQGVEMEVGTRNHSNHVVSVVCPFWRCTAAVKRVPTEPAAF